MKAGVLGVVDGNFDGLDSYTETVEENGHELRRSLQVDRVFSLSDGTIAFAGQAAAERLVSENRADIGDEISVKEEEQVRTVHTQFAGIPGELIAVSSNRGTFAFGLIAAATGTIIEKASLDIDAFFTTQNDSATPWKAGFYNNDAGSNGVLYGNDLRTEYELNSILEDASLNQLGLTYSYDGQELKMTATSSGYVEIYSPSTFETDDYLEYIQSEIQVVLN